jgi:hypothetical protein
MPEGGRERWRDGGPRRDCEGGREGPEGWREEAEGNFLGKSLRDSEGEREGGIT